MHAGISQRDMKHFLPKSPYIVRKGVRNARNCHVYPFTMGYLWHTSHLIVIVSECP